MEGSLATTVYRVNTVLGQPPSSCNDSDVKTLSVRYSAMYCTSFMQYCILSLSRSLRYMYEADRDFASNRVLLSQVVPTCTIWHRTAPSTTRTDCFLLEPNQPNSENLRRHSSFIHQSFFWRFRAHVLSFDGLSSHFSFLYSSPHISNRLVD